MPQPCTICTNAQRHAIDAALVEAAPNRRIAAQYAVSENAVRRHKAAHLPKALTMAAERAGVADADDLIAKLRGLEADARRIAEAAEQSKDLRTALAGVRELARIVELLAKLRGDLDESTKINVMNVGPEALASLRATLVARLADSTPAPHAIVVGAPELPPSR